ncbi:MAG: CoA pyrophosphatase [Bacteroidales bacterium]|nr:CoA pyrophosphatase [Bacteroidales bacterium]
MTNWISRLSEELQKPLPGVEAQLRMSPSLMRAPTGNTPFKKSGVLLLLFPCDDSICIVFIKRTEYEGVHSGQVSFPGGKYEENDLTLAHTALRETMEETGIPADEIKIIGYLTPLHIPVSNTDVFPYVGVSQNRPIFKYDPFEVEYLIEVRVEELMHPANQKHEIISMAGKDIEVPYFDIQNNHIWGATAMILSEFLEIAKKVMSDE